MYNTYKKVLEHFGDDAQKGKAVEELTELACAIVDDDRQNIIEEIADVLNMVEQLKIIYDISDYNINSEMESKMKRTICRIEAEVQK